MAKKIMALFLVCILVFPFVEIQANTEMTIEKAVELAIANSFSIQEVKVDLIKKDIELKQAHAAIKDIRKKETTVKFSLLFNIQFPEKHDMPQEIELITKVPTIENEIVVLEEKLVYETLNVQTQTETAYYNVLSEINGLEQTEQQLTATNQSLVTTENQWKRGEAPKTDVEYLESLVRDLETAKQKYLTNIDIKQKVLSSLVGTELRYGYNFTPYFPELYLERAELSEMTAYALEHNFDLFEKIQARKLAETEAESILQIYKSRYGSYINDIEAYIRSQEGKTMDYDYFIEKYNHTLTSIDSPWAGAFTINLIFFRISIPKEWFKGDLSGVRYMDDQKYALFVALVDRDKARNAEANAITALEDEIYQEYSTLKQMESAMQTAETSLLVAETDYDTKLLENKRQLVTFTTLESAKAAFYASQSNLYEMRLEYAKTLSALNLKTGGYVNDRLQGVDVSNVTLESGESFMGQATWKINQTITEYTFEFGVDIPDDYNVSQYELHYEEARVGNRTAIDETIIHLPLTYADSTLMEVRFYDDGVWTYTATFDGGQFEGELLMVAVDGAEVPEDPDTEGTWKLEQSDILRSDFTITVDTIVYDSYEVFADGLSLGKANKNGYVRTLSLYFSDKDTMSVSLYAGGKVVDTLDVGAGTSGGKLS
ncbi:MAG: TolC family protein [Bacillota bacterium]